MAFADPQSITINAVATSIPRVSTGVNGSTYQSGDGNTKLTVSSTYGKRTRRSVRIDSTKIAPNPLIAAQNIAFSMSAYLVVDVPLTGFSVAEQNYIVQSLSLWLSATSGSNTLKVLGGEN